MEEDFATPHARPLPASKHKINRLRKIAHPQAIHIRHIPEKMPRKSLTKPRKQASRDRSRALVDTLVEATARILVEEGFDKAAVEALIDEATRLVVRYLE
jgi:hypothetical protein